MVAVENTALENQNSEIETKKVKEKPLKPIMVRGITEIASFTTKSECDPDFLV